MTKLALASILSIATAGVALGGVLLPRIETKQLLRDCPGGPVGNADKCTFEPDGNVQTVYKYTASANLQASNCGGSEDPGEISFEVSSEEASSFTTGASAGIGIDGGEQVPAGVSISVEAEYTTGQSFTQSDKTTYAVPVNKQSAFIIQQPYDRHTGQLRVNYGSTVDGHYIWYVPDFKNDEPRAESEAEKQMYDFECGQVIPDEVAAWNSDPYTQQLQTL